MGQSKRRPDCEKNLLDWQYSPLLGSMLLETLLGKLSLVLYTLVLLKLIIRLILVAPLISTISISLGEARFAENIALDSGLDG